MLAAERGYEVAQSNVAYILDKDKRMLANLPLIGPKPNHEQPLETIKGLNEEESALIYWTRSANQNNIDSRVKMGDYYYKGIGAPLDYEKAVTCYRLAAEVGSPLAFWNLGWMYENGIGVAKDFHLAKRSYDQALSIDQDAYLPVKLSLIKMYVKYYWEWITGHEVGPALDNDKDKDTKSAAAAAKKRKEVDQKQYDIGEEMERQYKMKKQKEREEQERLGEDGSFSDDPYTLDDFSEEDELFESLLILSLCILVGYLVYVRQFRFGGNNQQEQQQQQQQGFTAGFNNPIQPPNANNTNDNNDQ
jgi:SEL1 protein